MSKKIIFKIDKELDFKNHLIGSNVVLRDNIKMSPETSDYFKRLRESTDKEKIKIFEEKTSKFYENKMNDFRCLLIKQTEEMWNLVENKYFNKMEEIHKKSFPLKIISGILSTTPMIYGYNFNGDSPWFACPYDSSVKAINTAMHEIMHTFFHKYFWEEYKNKFELTHDQIYKVKESVTVILDLEFNDIRISPDKGHAGHEELREKIKEDWLKYKDFEKVLDEACLFIKNN